MKDGTSLSLRLRSDDHGDSGVQLFVQASHCPQKSSLLSQREGRWPEKEQTGPPDAYLLSPPLTWSPIYLSIDFKMV